MGEFSSYTLKVVNGHIVIDDEQLLLIDTGSQISFHKSGNITLGKEKFNVPISVMGVTDKYLTQKVGAEINGVLGMDVIKKHIITISLKNKLLFFNDDAEYSCKLCPAVPCEKLGGLLSIELLINGRNARVLVDTGAPISYIDSSFVDGIERKTIVDDFSPYEGDFKVPTYECKVDLMMNNGRLELNSYKQDFGEMPPTISKIVSTLNMDGIIGYEFFKKFRLQINKGDIFFPPQGI